MNSTYKPQFPSPIPLLFEPTYRIRTGSHPEQYAELNCPPWGLLRADITGQPPILGPSRHVSGIAEAFQKFDQAMRDSMVSATQMPDAQPDDYRKDSILGTFKCCQYRADWKPWPYALALCPTCHKLWKENAEWWPLTEGVYSRKTDQVKFTITDKDWTPIGDGHKIIMDWVYDARRRNPNYRPPTVENFEKTREITSPAPPFTPRPATWEDVKPGASIQYSRRGVAIWKVVERLDDYRFVTLMGPIGETMRLNLYEVSNWTLIQPAPEGKP